MFCGPNSIESLPIVEINDNSMSKVSRESIVFYTHKHKQTKANKQKTNKAEKGGEAKWT